MSSQLPRWDDKRLGPLPLLKCASHPEIATAPVARPSMGWTIASEVQTKPATGYTFPGGPKYRQSPQFRARTAAYRVPS